MDSFPWLLLDEILFRIDCRSLAMMQCTNRSLRSHISINPNFKSEYFSRVGPSLLYMSTHGSHFLCYNLYRDSRSPRTEEAFVEFHILGSCSGLLLLFHDGLCVVNPLTKKFRFFNHSRSKFFPKSRRSLNGVTTLLQGRHQVFGFAVDQTDRTTQRFKIVIINEVRNGNETTYEFEINAGDSWKLSETTLTCHPSNLDDRMKKPVYMERSIHWLRNDGSIVAFNTKTEEARLIPIRFPKELCYKTLFTTADNNLTLISATEEVIYVYALENILSDPKWVLVKQIRNGVLDEKRLTSWSPEVYDGKCLVLWEMTMKNTSSWKDGYNRVLHGYDLRTNKWDVVGSIPVWCSIRQDFYQFLPSSSSVIGLDDKEKEEILACDDIKRTSSLISIMGLIDGISS